VAGPAGALPFSAVVGLRALVLVGQSLSPVKWDVSSQFTHLLIMCEHGFPFPAVQYREPHMWSLVWCWLPQYLQIEGILQWAPWCPYCRHLSQCVEASLRMYFRKLHLSP